MTAAIGVALVLAAIAFALWPLFRRSSSGQSEDPDPAMLRAALYRQILDAELDTQLGKLQQADYQELHGRLLQEAAALIVSTGAAKAVVADAQARVEHEIAAARAAMRGRPSIHGVNA
ncbi:MAG TPA: hypothetical protein VHX16_14080 [Chloroflexota bacterium]|nr:hypothetical protein [Chloroflexota bacterium]